MSILDRIKDLFILPEDNIYKSYGFSKDEERKEDLIETLENENRSLSARVGALNLQNSNLKKEIQALQRKLGMIENLPSGQPKRRRRRKSKKPITDDLV